jgi:WD40 repeat protein
MTKFHWLEVSEYASLSLSALGLVTAAVTQQMIYAAAPLTVTVCLNAANRERLKSLTQQQQQATIAKLDLLIDPLRQRLANFDTFTQKLSTTTQQQFQELRNNQEQDFNVFTEQFEQLYGSLLEITIKIQQQIQALQQYQQEQNIDTLKLRLIELDNLTQQLSTATQQQIDPLYERLAQLEALTQQVSQSTQQQIQALQQTHQEQNSGSLRQRLTQLDTLTQQLSTTTQQQIDPLYQRLSQLDSFTQQLNQYTQHHIQALQRTVNELNVDGMRQHLTQLDALTQQLTTNTQKQIQEFQYAIAVIQTELQELSQSKQQYQNVPEKKKKPEGFSPHPGQPTTKSPAPIAQNKQRTNSSPPLSPVTVIQSSNQVNNTTNEVLAPIVTPPTLAPTPENLTIENTVKQLSHKVTSVAFSPNGQILASGCDDKTIKIWHLVNEPRILKETGGFSCIEAVNSLAFSPDGKILASGSDDKTIRLLDISIGKEICSLTGHNEKVYSVAFSPDGKTLASGSKDKTIKLWSIDTYKETSTLHGHCDEVLCVAFSPDGKILASGAARKDKTIKVWYLAENKFLTLKSHSQELGGIHSIAFHPDGKQIASGSTDKTIKIWELSSGQELRTLTGHSDDVSSIAFSPDGNQLASGSKDKTVKLWQVDTGQEIRTFTEIEQPIYCLAFSPDGKTLAVGGNGDNSVMLLPCN